MTTEPKRLLLLEIFANPRSLEVVVLPEGEKGELVVHIYRDALYQHKRLYTLEPRSTDLEVALGGLRNFFNILINQCQKILSNPEKLSPDSRQKLAHRGLLMSPNDGVTPEVADWICERIRSSKQHMVRTCHLERRKLPSQRTDSPDDPSPPATS